MSFRHLAIAAAAAAAFCAATPAAAGSFASATLGQFGYTGQTLTLDNLPMSAGFTNFTADALTGQLSLTVSVNGNSPLTPITEPGSAALLLAGLAGLGWLARRRRS